MSIYKPKRKIDNAGNMEEIKIPYSSIDGTPDLSTKVDKYQNLGQNKDAVYSVVGNVDGTAGTWTGTLDGLTAYYDGLKIYYHIGTAGASTTKLNINSLGAKTVYRYSTTKLGTQYGKNYIIPLVYSTSLNSGCWMVMADYDSTETYTIRSRGRFTAGGVGVFQYSLFAETAAGTVESFTTTSGTGTSKVANTSAKFIIGKPVYYYNYNETIASGSKIRQDYAYIYAPTVDVRYTGNYTDSSFGTYRSVYLNITVDKTTNTYSPTSSLIVSTTGLVSGQYYIYLGYSYSSSAYQFSKINDVAIYYYNGTNLIKIDITNPTKTSELTNDSGFITSASIPTKLSSFTDDLGSSPVHTHSQYLTSHQDISGKANLNGGNTFNDTQLFQETWDVETADELTNQLRFHDSKWDIFTVTSVQNPTEKTAIAKNYVWMQDNDNIYAQYKTTGIYYGNDTVGYDGTLSFPTGISGTKVIATTDQIPTVPSAGTTASAVSSSSSGGNASTWSKSDHVHNVVVGTGDSNGQVKIAGQNASVKGLAAHAYYADDATHRVVTDTEKSTWNGKQNAITSSNKLDYSLIANTPTIPTVNNATISIKQGATIKGSFTLNQSNNQTIQIDAGSGGSSNWGDIGGTLSDQTDLQEALDSKASQSDLSNYLPLTAGTGKKLTGTLYANGGLYIYGDDTTGGSITKTNDGCLVSSNASDLILRGNLGNNVYLYNSGTSTYFKLPTNKSAATKANALSLATVDDIPDISGKADLRTSLSMVPYGTAIPAEADLNTLDYIRVGNYYCSQNATAQTQIHCPTTSAYMMVVYSPLSTTIDNETTSAWVYRTRLLRDLGGNEYFQLVNSGATAGEFSYGPWIRTATVNDFANVAYKNIDNNFSVKQTVTGGMKVTGRYQGSGDDEGLIVGLASNNYAGVILGDPSGERVVLYNNAGTHTAMVRHHNGSSSYDMKFPDVSGDIVVLSSADYTKLKALLGQIQANPSSSGVTFLSQVNAPTFNGTT